VFPVNAVDGLAAGPFAVDMLSVGAECGESGSESSKNGFVESGLSDGVFKVGRGEAGEVLDGEVARLRKGLLELRLTVRRGDEGCRSI
jgi:hypothetical protein